MGERYLEKAQETGRLIVPSKLGAIPEEAYDLDLSELSLAGKAHRTVFLPHGMGGSRAEPKRGILTPYS
jgi:hypothetical protein